MTRVLFLVVYLVMLVLIVLGMNSARRATLAEFGTAEAIDDWDDWRQSAAEADASAPVQRRVSPSAEPPALVLMRDYFVVCLLFALVLSSLLYGTLALMMFGAWRAPAAGNSEAPKDLDG